MSEPTNTQPGEQANPLPWKRAAWLRWLTQQERNEVVYWLGLLALLIGLALETSVGSALSVVGAAMAAESVATSYLAAWLSYKASA